MLPYQEPLPLVWQKQAFDYVVSLFLLVFTAPLILLVVLLMIVEHCLRGHPLDPIFYSEKRISRGTPFKLYKFNIFDQRVVDTYRRQNKFIHTKDLEINGELIFIGKILKQIYIDELPQLYNVLKGEMSLVGPRPLNLEVFEQAKTSGIPPQALILGGMTGSFQSLKDTRGLSALTLESDYLRKYALGGWSIVYVDVKIILRTLMVLLRAKGV